MARESAGAAPVSSAPYKKDVHQYLTTALAEAAGFRPEDAAAIGRAAQHIDDNPRTAPTPPLNFEARRKYHFTTPEQRQELWNDFRMKATLADHKDALQSLGSERRNSNLPNYYLLLGISPLLKSEDFLRRIA